MHIWVPNKKIIENTRPEAPPGGRVGGLFRIVGRRDDGRSRLIMDWTPNLITDLGLERWGTGNIFAYCHVGAGTTAPQVTDTALQSYLATSNSNPSYANSAQATAPYYGWTRATYRFNPPGVNRTLGEVGMGWTTGNTGNLWSRSLIKDVNGNPTTIQWLAEETLDVSYELRKYPFLEDVAYSDVIGGVTYTGVQRCAMVTNGNYWIPYNQVQTLQISGLSYPLTLYTGTIGAITGQPSGTYLGQTSMNQAAYAANSHKRSGSFTYGPTVSITAKSWNFLTTVAWIQKSITPDLVKPVDWTLVVNVESPTWGRYP